MRAWSAIVASMFIGAYCGRAATTSAQHAAAASSDPRAIMEAVHERAAGERRSSRIRMKITDASGSRERGMLIRSASSKDSQKSLIIIESPADSRGSGFLTIDYRDRSKDDERWLYLPKLRRTTRIATGQLSNAFMGSDFSFADMSPPDPELFAFTLKASSVSVDGEECWLIVAKPKTTETAESVGYREAEFWVSKAKRTFVRVKVSLLDGKTKYIQASSFENTPHGWIPRRIEARTVLAGKLVSDTVLQVTSLNTDDDTVTDADFTKQRLERGL